MRIHFVQHVDFEDLGNIEPWARERGHSIMRTRLQQRERLPGPGEYDWLIVMGGPMSVDEEARYPWLAREKVFIKRSIELGKRVLGVCLGAQLIADALGAPVTRNAHKEIGWFPVLRSATPDSSPFAGAFPENFHAFHWHGDTFAIPEGAVHLALSDACANQAFSVGNNVLALQFHLESNSSGVGRLLRHCSQDLQPGTYVQDPDQIRSGCQDHMPGLEPLLHGVLETMEGLG